MTPHLGCPAYGGSSTDVWARRGTLAKPNSSNPTAGIAQTRSLTGAHRKLAQTVTAHHPTA
ncbi:hypothetical protein [Phytohabitans rumicis]|uniref:Uncharacterized protein n=1 Tax=Phytohabitans rumicis TaxID=1076125 RepID=A0A6V8LAK1_9ACTN|nr:hypothetical protein [Phytohabitans rumicis]GFJ93374.1 hypothetical protein Prum_070160 [Phytohabitans rumicis]